MRSWLRYTPSTWQISQWMNTASRQRASTAARSNSLRIKPSIMNNKVKGNINKIIQILLRMKKLMQKICTFSLGHSLGKLAFKNNGKDITSIIQIKQSSLNPKFSLFSKSTLKSMGAPKRDRTTNWVTSSFSTIWTRCCWRLN